MVIGLYILLSLQLICTQLKQEKTVTFPSSPINSDDEGVAEGVAAAPAAAEPPKKYKIQRKPEVVATTRSKAPESAANDDSVASSTVLGHKSLSPTSVADDQCEEPSLSLSLFLLLQRTVAYTPACIHDLDTIRGIVYLCMYSV